MDLNVTRAINALPTILGQTVKVSANVPSFFRSMFTDVVSNSIVYEYDEFVNRETVFDDTTDFAEPKMFKRTKFTTKGYTPPIIHVGNSFSAFSHFDVLRASDTYVASAQYKFFQDQVIADAQLNADAIARTEELWCARAMQTGTVPLKSKASIDFKPKASHLKAYSAGTDISINTVDPAAMFIPLCDAIVSDGKVSSSMPIPCIIGGSVLSALQNNPIVQKRLDIKNFDLGMMVTGFTDAKGLTPHGYVKYGNYTIVLYTYAETYEDPADGQTKYLFDQKSVMVFGQSMQNIMFYAALPEAFNPMNIMASKKCFYTETSKFEMLYGQYTRPLPIMKEINKVAIQKVLN